MENAEKLKALNKLEKTIDQSPFEELFRSMKLKNCENEIDDGARKRKCDKEYIQQKAEDKALFDQATYKELGIETKEIDEIEENER